MTHPAAAPSGAAPAPRQALRLVIVTDAWEPQVNGVVTTMRNTSRCLEEMGHEVTLITPQAFRSLPCPGYKEIRLSVFPARKVARLMEQARPDAVHIVTEGPLGMAARAWCRPSISSTGSSGTPAPPTLKASGSRASEVRSHVARPSFTK